jgi:hypothetical protein
MMRISLTENAPALSVVCASAPCYGITEDVCVLPVVVAPLKFRDVQGQILGRHVIEAAHDAALQQRSDAVDDLSVDDPAHVFAFAVANGLIDVVGRQPEIAAVFIGRDQAKLVGHGGTDEMPHRLHVGLVGMLAWFKVICLMLTSKKGMSALQIQRMMDFGQLDLAHRRDSMPNGEEYGTYLPTRQVQHNRPPIRGVGSIFMTRRIHRRAGWGKNFARRFVLRIPRAAVDAHANRVKPSGLQSSLPTPW